MVLLLTTSAMQPQKDASSSGVMGRIGISARGMTNHWIRTAQRGDRRGHLLRRWDMPVRSRGDSMTFFIHLTRTFP